MEGAAGEAARRASGHEASRTGVGGRRPGVCGRADDTQCARRQRGVGCVPRRARGAGACPARPGACGGVAQLAPGGVSASVFEPPCTPARGERRRITSGQSQGNRTVLTHGSSDRGSCPVPPSNRASLAYFAVVQRDL